MRGFIVAPLCLMAPLLFAPPETAAVVPGRASALRQIDSIVAVSSGNTPALRRIRGYADSAEHNIGAIVEVARLLSEFGYHSDALVEVARLASKTNFECPYFNQIASLVIRHMSETMKILDLARRAGQAHFWFQRKALESALERAEREADFQSLDEARAFQKHQNKMR